MEQEEKKEEKKEEEEEGVTRIERKRYRRYRRVPARGDPVMPHNWWIKGRSLDGSLP